MAGAVAGGAAAAWGAAATTGVAASLGAHEGAHAVIASRCGYRVDDVTLAAAGGITRYSGPPPSPREQVAIAAAGPLASAAIALVLARLAPSAGGPAAALGFGAGPNALAAAANLVPLPSLDGGEVASGLVRAVRERPGRAQR